jgi:hypothetical protein
VSSGNSREQEVLIMFGGKLGLSELAVVAVMLHPTQRCIQDEALDIV